MDTDQSYPPNTQPPINGFKQVQISYYKKSFPVLSDIIGKELDDTFSQLQYKQREKRHKTFSDATGFLQIDRWPIWRISYPCVS